MPECPNERLCPLLVRDRLRIHPPPVLVVLVACACVHVRACRASLLARAFRRRQVHALAGRRPRPGLCRRWPRPRSTPQHDVRLVGGWVVDRPIHSAAPPPTLPPPPHPSSPPFPAGGSWWVAVCSSSTPHDHHTGQASSVSVSRSSLPYALVLRASVRWCSAPL